MAGIERGKQVMRKPRAGKAARQAAEVEEAEASSTGGIDTAPDQEGKAGSTSGTDPITPSR